jgi:competence protein ComFC
MESDAEHGLCPTCFRRLLLECSVQLHISKQNTLMNGSCGVYKGLLRQALLTWKKQGNRILVHQLAQLLAAYLPASTWNYSITSLPGHRRQCRIRGWDPGSELAKKVCDLQEQEYVSCFVRTKKSHMQKTLNRMQRLENAALMFQVKEIQLPEKILIIDDIRTTGASIQAAYELLKSAGVKKIAYFTLAQD